MIYQKLWSLNKNRLRYWPRVLAMKKRLKLLSRFYKVVYSTNRNGGLVINPYCNFLVVYVCQKNYENWLTWVKVMSENTAGPFRDTVYVIFSWRLECQLHGQTSRCSNMNGQNDASWLLQTYRLIDLFCINKLPTSVCCRRGYQSK